MHHFAGIGMDDLPGDVVDRRGRMIEGHAFDGHGAIADRAQHQAGRDDLELADSSRPQRPVGIHDQLVLLDPQGRDPAICADDLHRRGEKAQDDAARGCTVRARSVVVQNP